MVMLPAMDVDQLERAVDAAPGDEMIVRKDQLLHMLSAIRRGQKAERSLINIGSMASVAAGAMRVPSGYIPPTLASAP